MIEFLELGAKLAGLCAVSYVAASLPFRVVEFPVSARASGVRPAPTRYAFNHAVGAILHALITPAICYVLVGLLFRAGSFQSPQFSQSLWYWAALWGAGLLMPVQTSYYVNGRLFSGPDLAVRPQWLIYYWGVNSCAAATVMWLPLWLGWVTL